MQRAEEKNSQLYPNIKIVKELLHICARCRESKCNVKGWIMTLMLEYSILLPHTTYHHIYVNTISARYMCDLPVQSTPTKHVAVFYTLRYCRFLWLSYQHKDAKNVSISFSICIPLYSLPPLPVLFFMAGTWCCIFGDTLWDKVCYDTYCPVTIQPFLCVMVISWYAYMLLLREVQ